MFSLNFVCSYSFAVHEHHRRPPPRWNPETGGYRICVLFLVDSHRSGQYFAFAQVRVMLCLPGHLNRIRPPLWKLGFLQRFAITNAEFGLLMSAHLYQVLFCPLSWACLCADHWELFNLLIALGGITVIGVMGQVNHSLTEDRFVFSSDLVILRWPQSVLFRIRCL